MPKWIVDTHKAAAMLGLHERQFRDFVKEHEDELKPIVFGGDGTHRRYFWRIADIERVKQEVGQ